MVLAGALWLLLTPMSAQAWECADWGVWFNDRCIGTKDAWKHGDWNLFVPFYTWHAPWDYNNRAEQNSFPLGGGIARSVQKARDTDMLYAMAFQDSHYKPMYVAGYGYIYDWGEQTSIHAGIGFTAFLWARTENNYIPLPGIAPIGSVGFSRLSVMGTYLPFINVAMFWARAQF
jgi:lipid IVA palmitoyltransferase